MTSLLDTISRKSEIEWLAESMQIAADEYHAKTGKSIDEQNKKIQLLRKASVFITCLVSEMEYLQIKLSQRDREIAKLKEKDLDEF